MGKVIAALVVNAVAIVVAINVAPDIVFRAADTPVAFATVAIIFTLLNTFLKPILRLLSFPIRLVTLGLFSVVINGALLLLLAWISGQLDITFTIGGFPPDFSAQTVVAAAIAAIIVSVVATVLSFILPD